MRVSAGTWMMTEATLTTVGAPPPVVQADTGKTELSLLISINSRWGVAVMPSPYCVPDRINGYESVHM